MYNNRYILYIYMYTYIRYRVYEARILPLLSSENSPDGKPDAHSLRVPLNVLLQVLALKLLVYEALSC
jgi:hypothetical protein